MNNAQKLSKDIQEIKWLINESPFRNCPEDVMLNIAKVVSRSEFWGELISILEKRIKMAIQAAVYPTGTIIPTFTPDVSLPIPEASDEGCAHRKAGQDEMLEKLYELLFDEMKQVGRWDVSPEGKAANDAKREMIRKIIRIRMHQIRKGSD